MREREIQVIEISGPFTCNKSIPIIYIAKHKKIAMKLTCVSLLSSVSLQLPSLDPMLISSLVPVCLFLVFPVKNEIQCLQEEYFITTQEFKMSCDIKQRHIHFSFGNLVSEITTGTKK